jgi:hypothetical protein
MGNEAGRMRMNEDEYDAEVISNDGWMDACGTLFIAYIPCTITILKR